jgi:hypothetical protein
MNENVKKYLTEEQSLDKFDAREFTRYKNDHYKGHRYFAILEGMESHTILYFCFAQWRKVEHRIQWMQMNPKEQIKIQILKF